MLRKPRRSDMQEINSSSMSDIAFLLLVFFLVTTTISLDKGISLILPAEGNELEVNKKNIVNILINDKGKVLLDDEPTKIEKIKMIAQKKISANPKIRVRSGKPVVQEVTNIKAKVNYLYFNDDECVRAKGAGTGEMVDVFGLFSQNLKINLKLSCKENLFEVAFKSAPDSILEGEVLIKTNLEYNLEARSKRLSSKIREASKLNFTKDPSFKITGRLDELMNIY